MQIPVVNRSYRKRIVVRTPICKQVWDKELGYVGRYEMLLRDGETTEDLPEGLKKRKK